MDEALKSAADGAPHTVFMGLPIPRGFAARLSPAGLPGAWIDVTALAGGYTGVVLGCCAEKAAAERLRSGMRDALLRNGDPVRSLDCMDGMDGVPVSAMAAVIGSTTIAYSARGGMATAVVAPDTGPTVGPDGHLFVYDLAPGATVLLSTAPIPGAAALLDVGAATHPDDLVDRVTSDPGLSGVGTVLYRHPPAPTTPTLAATPANLAVSRGRLREWLSAAGVDRESCADVLLAAGEATANSTEHSVVDADHEVELTVSAALSGNVLILTVSDNGRWKPAAGSPGHRGHGMRLINALVDSVELTATPSGTTVAMLKEVP